MKKNILFFGSLLLLLNAVIADAQTQAGFQWVAGGGGYANSSTDPARTEDARYMAADNAGHIYVVSNADQYEIKVDTFHVATNYGNNDLLVSCFRCDGKLAWARRLGGANFEEAMGIAADGNGNVYVSGILGNYNTPLRLGDTTIASNTILKGFTILKFDSTGHLKWWNMPGPNNANNNSNYGIKLKIDGTGKLNVFFHHINASVPNWEGVTLQHGYYYVAKIDTGNGSVTNVVTLDMEANIKPKNYNDFDMDAQGNYYYFSSEITTSTGERLGTNWIYNDPNYPDDIETYVVSFNPNGNYRWHNVVKTFNLTDSIFNFFGLAVSNTSVYLTGRYQKKLSFLGTSLSNPYPLQYSSFVTKLNSNNGNLAWIRTGHGPYGAQTYGLSLGPNGIAFTSAEALLILGSDTVKPFPPPLSNSAYPYVAFIDTNGNWGASKAFKSSPGVSYGLTTVSDNIGNVYVGGLFQDSIYADNGQYLHSQGGWSDFFVARYGTANGCICPLSNPVLQQKTVVNKTVSVKGIVNGAAADSTAFIWGDGSKTLYTTPGSVINHTYTTGGNYNVCMRTYNTCGNKDTCSAITTGIAALGLEDQLLVYPNPVKEELHLVWKGTPQTMQATIVDMSGRTIANYTLTAKENTIPMQSLAPGMYLIYCTMADGSRGVVKVEKE